MKRQFSALEEQPFDVLIVGAGIYGACLAWTSSRRGLKTALVDAADFGGSASANSLKIIHGGLRYLQHGNLKRMRESIRARRRFLAIAPETVKPLACMIPTRGAGSRSRWIMAAALAANAAISWDRNRDLRSDRRLAAGGIISVDEFRSLVPLASVEGFSGAARWHDAIAENTDRLNLSIVQSAAESGAVVVNYARAVKILQDGAELEDVLTGRGVTVRARQVVCAAGPGNEKLRPEEPRGRWVKASNLILKKALVKDCALGIEGTAEFTDSNALIRRGHRNFFVVPWRGGTMIGTSYAPFDTERDEERLTSAELETFVREINATNAFPPISVADVHRVHVGILPAGGHDAEPAKESTVARDAHGTLFLQGVKYTTAIETADELADVIQTRLGVRVIRPADTPLPWTPPPERAAVAVENEMAVKLIDFIFRRSTLGDFGLPDRNLLNRCADDMAHALQWNVRQREAEIADVIRACGLPVASA